MNKSKCHRTLINYCLPSESQAYSLIVNLLHNLILYFILYRPKYVGLLYFFLIFLIDRTLFYYNIFVLLAPYSMLQSLLAFGFHFCTKHYYIIPMSKCELCKIKHLIELKFSFAIHNHDRQCFSTDITIITLHGQHHVIV